MRRHKEVVQTKIPNCSGVYIRGLCSESPITFTVDSGASKTVLSSKVFELINDKYKCKLNTGVHIPLQQARGNPLRVHGVIELVLEMGEFNKTKSVIVADIKDYVLLGVDIGEEIDILTSKHQVVYPVFIGDRTEL